jgi:hypothetical protein
MGPVHFDKNKPSEKILGGGVRGGEEAKRKPNKFRKCLIIIVFNNTDYTFSTV